MAWLTVLDTGYLKPTNEGTQLDSGDRANSGTAMSLRSTEFKPSVSANFDDSPVLESDSDAEVNVGTFENMKFTLLVRIDMGVAAQRSLIYPLVRLVQTKGYKVLYYASTSDDEELVSQLANSHTFTSGEQSAFSLGGAYAHLHVFFKSVAFSVVSKKRKTVVASLVGTVTKSEDSVV